jgi:hypothetical protein
VILKSKHLDFFYFLGVFDSSILLIYSLEGWCSVH